ncbi:hypothetical protein OIDMADRAFT_35807 [Oidiodendron maius Zn]|uniref:Uncharacterized protein n=1 Tax=Oidiodendron maius (strain Zn) TaxID=913774 RepID=A0A0C3GS62_OIDMZ|nr:hypothetical protein OIDMADRAFT_35807 [Oidiodendron maius Zn]
MQLSQKARFGIRNTNSLLEAVTIISVLYSRYPAAQQRTPLLNFTMLSQILILLHIGLAVCSPVTAEYHYHAGGKEVRRPAHNVPVTFNGVAIGTTELNSTATSGTRHSISDGHHFTHQGWVLTDNNEPAWEYLPDIRSKVQAKSKVKRATDDIVLLTFDGDTTIKQMVTDFIFHQGYSVDVITSNALTVARDISWSEATPAILDLFDAGSFVTSSTSLTGDFADLFFDALEFFAFT